MNAIYAYVVLSLAIAVLLYLLYRSRRCLLSMLAAMALITVILLVGGWVSGMLLNLGEHNKIAAISRTLCDGLDKNVGCGVTLYVGRIEVRIGSKDVPLNETVIELVSRRAKNLKPLLFTARLTVKFRVWRAQQWGPPLSGPGSYRFATFSHETYKTIVY